jgi:hypothetical protein
MHGRSVPYAAWYDEAVVPCQAAARARHLFMTLAHGLVTAAVRTDHARDKAPTQSSHLHAAGCLTRTRVRSIVTRQTAGMGR